MPLLHTIKQQQPLGFSKPESSNQMSKLLQMLKKSELVKLITEPFGLATIVIKNGQKCYSPVPHLSAFINQHQPSVKEQQWNSAFGKNRLGISTSVFVIGWHDPYINMSTECAGPQGFEHNSNQAANYNESAQQSVYIAAITGIDHKTRSFTITNEFNRLGPGNSGGLVVGIINNQPVILGFINSLTRDHYKLRCVRSDSIGVKETYPTDLDICKFKRPSTDEMNKLYQKIADHKQLHFDKVTSHLRRIEGLFQQKDGSFNSSNNGKQVSWEVPKNDRNFDLRHIGLNQKEQLTLGIGLAFNSLESEIKKYESKQQTTILHYRVETNLRNFESPNNYDTLGNDKRFLGESYNGAPVNVSQKIMTCQQNNPLEIEFNINFDHVLNKSGLSPKTDHIGFTIQIGSGRELNGHILVDNLSKHHRS